MATKTFSKAQKTAIWIAVISTLGAIIVAVVSRNGGSDVKRKEEPSPGQIRPTTVVANPTQGDGSINIVQTDKGSISVVHRNDEQLVRGISERLDRLATKEDLAQLIEMLRQAAPKSGNPDIKAVIEHARKRIADTLTIQFKYNSVEHQIIGLADEAEARLGDFLVAKATMVDVHFRQRSDGTQIGDSVEVEETHFALDGSEIYQGRLFFPMPFGGVTREIETRGKRVLQVFTQWPR